MGTFCHIPLRRPLAIDETLVQEEEEEEEEKQVGETVGKVKT